MQGKGRQPKTGKGGSSRSRNDEEKQESSVPQATQQKLLNIFRDALWTDSSDVDTVQEVKGHLYKRDFDTAFGQDQYLRAYALRWSASRALAYAQIFCDVEQYLPKDKASSVEPKGSIGVLCLGGGAGGELVGLAAWLHLRDCKTDVLADSSQRPLRVSLVDKADWSVVYDSLSAGLFKPPLLSKYASAAARERNQALLPPDAMSSMFSQRDILQWDEASLKTAAGQADVVTIMFTLNELYSSSTSRTQHLLNHLTTALCPGSLLLVVDSPGSYSTIALNGVEKKYPMHWLVDRTLLQGAKWEKVVSDESKWFRLPEGLSYCIELENMRCQIHLYRRLSD